MGSEMCIRDRSTTISAGRQEEMKLENEPKQSLNLTLNKGEEVGDGEGARGGCPVAKALDDRAHRPHQPVDVRL